MTSQPYILLLSLQKLDGFDGLNSDLLSALRTVADLKQASTFSQAKRRLTQAPIPKAVIVTDEAVTEPSYSQILLKLVRYCNAGGNVVFACQFSSLAQGPKITDMFHKSFDLPWTPGSYTRSEFVLNKTVKGLDTGNLAPGYLVKALHLAHVPRDAAVYLPCVSGQTESSREAPAAFTDVGRGHVGYVGDVNTEGASIDLIIAMCLASRDLTETSHSSSARPLCQKPTILMLSLEKEEWLEDTYSQLYAGLRKNAIVHEALTDQDANRHLSAPLPPYAVLVTDATISKPRYSSLVSLLVGFVRKGGRLVFGCQFSNHLQMNMVAPFFARWGLPWHAGSYYRTTFALNPAGIPAPLSRSALFPTYSLKALHLKLVRRAVAVYLPTSGSRVESHVFEPTPISGPQLEESPAVFEPVGSGYVGYVGDVNGEQGSTRLLIEMCGVSLKPGDLGTQRSLDSVTMGPNGIQCTYNDIPEVPLPASQERPPRPREAEVAARAVKRTALSREKKRLAEALKDGGNDLFREQKYTEAAEKYREAALTYGPRPVFMTNLAAALLKMNSFIMAESAASRALNYEPKNVKALYRRGLSSKGVGQYADAIRDFRRVLRLDPASNEARTELAATMALQSSIEPVYDQDEDDDEQDEEDSPLEIATESDSSEFEHDGNGTPCRFNNHGGCRHGSQCRFKHAPDDKSVRDELGRNVCLMWLLGRCRFGDVRCVYAHDKTYLPQRGWWNNEEQLTTLHRKLHVLDQAGLPSRQIEQALRDVVGSPWRKDPWTYMPYEYRKKKDDQKLLKKGLRQVAEQDNDFGFTQDECEELLSQGVKPWDDDAWDVLQALGG